MWFCLYVAIWSCLLLCSYMELFVGMKLYEVVCCYVAIWSCLLYVAIWSCLLYVAVWSCELLCSYMELSVAM